MQAIKARAEMLDKKDAMSVSVTTTAKEAVPYLLLAPFLSCSHRFTADLNLTISRRCFHDVEMGRHQMQLDPFLKAIRRYHDEKNLGDIDLDFVRIRGRAGQPPGSPWRRATQCRSACVQPSASDAEQAKTVWCATGWPGRWPSRRPRSLAEPSGKLAARLRRGTPGRGAPPGGMQCMQI